MTSPTLEEVTTKYETIYQGTESTPGLWTVETLLVNKSVIDSIAAKYKVGVVTGRPRLDAERFLKQVSLYGTK